MSSFDLSRAALLAPLLLLCAAPAFADDAPPAPSPALSTSSTGSLHGTAADVHGHPLSGAHVTLRNGAGDVLDQTRADDSGAFTFTAVAPGNYTVNAEKSGSDSVSTAITVPAGGAPVSVSLGGAAKELNTVTVTAKRFERARIELSPSTGSSQYVFDHKTIENLPQGEATPLNQVLLQAPGVANDSYGQLHVRGDHADLQYRINGIILPEGVATFGQTFDTRFIDKLDLLTGALPAQYGYRTAGVVDITTKQSINGGNVDFYGGSHGTLNPSVQGGYTQDGFSGFFSGSYLSSTLGLEPPTPGANAIHDRTTQGRGFGYLSYLLGEHLKLSGIFGATANRFEIPNNPGQTPDSGYLAELGLNGFDSATLDERQYERNQYGIVALQGLGANDLNYQIAAFGRQSAVEFTPDDTGDLAFNGDASQIKRKSRLWGFQGDASYPLSARHTLRGGVYASTEDDRADNTSRVFPTTPAQADGACPAGSTPSDSGQCLSGGPVTIVDNNPKNGNTLLGVYLQDQWDITDAVTINYGLRYDKLDAYVSASQVSPRVGVVWFASPGTTVHAGYARYFTPPVNELIANSSFSKFDNTTNSFEVQQNSPVQPERQHYFDVGVVQQIVRGLTVGLDGYYKYIRELQDEGQFGQALIFAPFNYQQGHVAGLELTSSFRRGDFSAYLNLAKSRANGTRVRSGEFNFDAADLAYIENHYIYLDHDQSFTASAGASYVLLRTTVGIDGTYGSGLRKDAVDAEGNTLIPNGEKLRPNLQLNLSASRTVHVSDGFGDVKLRLAALNVLDRSNIIHDGTGIGVEAAQYGPRAALYFGVTKPFGS